MSQLWAALSIRPATKTKAPKNCVWTRQIRPSLAWIQAFLRKERGTISRVFTYEACRGLAAPVQITTDASVWGVGGWLSLAGRPIAYFSDDITPQDEQSLGHARGDHHGQQGFEALALLIAVRIWAPVWKSSRGTLALRSDNMGALSVFSACKGKEGPMNLVAREFALDVGQATHMPDLVQHLPGVSNQIADALSRRTDLQYAKGWQLPSFLAGATHIKLEPRGPSWWRTSLSPGSA